MAGQTLLPEGHVLAWMDVEVLLPQDKEAPLVEADEGCRGSNPVSLLFQLWVTLVDSLCGSPPAWAEVRTSKAPSY